MSRQAAVEMELRMPERRAQIMTEVQAELEGGRWHVVRSHEGTAPNVDVAFNVQRCVSKPRRFGVNRRDSPVSHRFGVDLTKIRKSTPSVVYTTDGVTLANLARWTLLTV